MRGGLLRLLCVAAALAPAGCSDRAPVEESTPPLIGLLDTGVDRTGLAHAIDRTHSVSLVPGEPLDDVVGHGTEMAWIVHRAAPAARLVAVKVVDRHGATTDERLAAAFEHLRRSGATVALVSLSGAAPLPRTRDAIERSGASGVVVVAAAGNDGIDLDRGSAYPASYVLDNLISVAATDPSGELLGSSNRGGTIARTAAGVVRTCSLGGVARTSRGTSAAAALVAAAAGQDDPTRSMESRVRAVLSRPILPPSDAECARVAGVELDDE